MLDIQFIRDNPQAVAEKSKQKGYDINIGQLLELDTQRRTRLTQIEELRARRNAQAAELRSQKPTDEQIALGKQLKQEVANLETELASIEAQYTPLLKSVPNMPLDRVPIGASENENVVVKVVGDKPSFDFKPKNHWEIAEAKDWIDKDRAAKISGARFVYLKGDLVRLEMALWQFGMDVLGNSETLQKIIADAGLTATISSKPFTPIIPPAVARTEVFQATGRLNKEEQTYKLEDEDLWLNASAEHTLSPMYMNETLPEAEFPIRLVGYTTAFRREAGTYGKDTEGIFRLHQFNKLEMESFTTADNSLDEHLFMVAVQEYLMSQLGIPYQVLEKCTADIGRPNAKGVDVEMWLPSQDVFRETHTADYLTDYQARPMKTRVKRSSGQVELVHTNDATVFSERPMIGIIENFQTVEGNVVIPEVLRRYMGDRTQI